MGSERHTTASSLPEAPNARPHVLLREYKADGVTHIVQTKEPRPSKGERMQIHRSRCFWKQRRDSSFHCSTHWHGPRQNLEADEKAVASEEL